MKELKALEMTEVEEIFNKTIGQNVYDFNGEIIEGVEAFSIDIVKEFKSTKNSQRPQFGQHQVPFVGNVRTATRRPTTNANETERKFERRWQ